MFYLVQLVFCNPNILIYQITKPSKQLKKLSKNSNNKWNAFILKFIFLGPKMSVSNKLGLFLYNLDKIFPIESSEFWKLLYFESNSNKTGTKF